MKIPVKVIIFLSIFALFFGPVYSQTITVTSPDGGENWDLGSTHNVTWTSSGVTGNVGVKLFQNGSSLGYVAQNISVSDGKYSWTISNVIGVGPISAGSNYQIQVKQSGVAGDLSDGNFVISPGATQAGKISVTSPCSYGSNVTLWEKTGINIEWNATPCPGGNVKITMTYANCPGSSGPVPLILFIISASTPNDGSFSWTTPDVSSSKCYKISIKKIGADCAGSSGIFKVRPKMILKPSEKFKLYKLIKIRISDPGPDPWWYIDLNEFSDKSNGAQFQIDSFFDVTINMNDPAPEYLNILLIRGNKLIKNLGKLWSHGAVEWNISEPVNGEGKFKLGPGMTNELLADSQTGFKVILKSSKSRKILKTFLVKINAMKMRIFKKR